MPLQLPQPDRGPAESFPGDKHIIDTPEQTPLQFAVAGVGSRFLALAIDTLIQTGVGLALGLALFLIGLSAPAAVSRLAAWILAAAIVAAFLLYFGNFACFEIFWNGQTPGKRAIGIRVVKEDGRPLTAAETIGRNLFRIVDQMPGFYAVAIVVALLNSRNKRLGDFAVGSMVVREAALADLKPAWQMVAAPPAERVSILGTERLSSDQLNLIAAFLNRRSELTADLRLAMAERILAQLQLKLNPPPGLSPEAILEALAYEERAQRSYR